MAPPASRAPASRAPASRAPASRAAVPAPGEARRGEQGYLAYLLRQANGVVRAEMTRGLAGLDITPPQFSVLTMLQAYPSISGADLARLSMLTPQTVNLITRKLEAAGLVGRAPDPVHGRIQRLAVTDRGRALLSECAGAAQEMERFLKNGLSSEEEVIVRRWLAAVAVSGAGASDE